MSSHSRTAKRLVAVTVVCCIPGFCFVLVGTFGPAWVEVISRSTEVKVREGIWLATLCRNYSGLWHCYTSTRSHVLTDAELRLSTTTLDESHWLEFQILSVFAIVGSLLTVVITTLVLVQKWKSLTWTVLSVGAVGSILASMFMMVPILKIASVSLRYEAINKSWTFVLGVLGSAFHFVAAIILVFAVYRSCRQYCQHKEHRRAHHRRLEMVVQYLVTQTYTDHENGTVTIFPGPTEEVNVSGSDSGVGTLSSPSPYTDRDALPAYSEISGS